jgi:DNA-binding response OmpR family regulator
VSVIAGKRFLIAEDDPIIGILLASLLTDEGAVTCDRATTLAEAQEKLASSDYDAALFDVRLGSEFSFPAADTARAKGIKILFTSGSSSYERPPAMADVPWLSKPYLVEEALEKIAGLFAPVSG